VGKTGGMAGAAGGRVRRRGTPLRGRATELAALGEVTGGLADGRGGTALVLGEAGIGKSRLIGEVVGDAAAIGAVYQASVEELEQGRPFAVLVDALRCWPGSDDLRRTRVAGLLSGRVDVGPTSNGGAFEFLPDTRFQVQEAILELVGALVADGPMALVLEDLHWADVSTLSTVLAVARRFRHEPLALLLSARSVEHAPELQRLASQLDDLDGIVLELPPLDGAAVTEVVVDLTGAHPGPNLAARVGDANGIPFYVQELIRSLQADDGLVLDDGTAELQDPARASSVGQGLVRRVARLEPAVAEVLRSAAVLGRSCTVAELAAVTGLEPADLVAPITAGVVARLLDQHDDGIRFRHDLLRQAVYEQLPAAVRPAVHRSAALALAATGAHVERVAAQFALGATPGDQEAVDWLSRAADRVAPTDPAGALGLYDRAITLAEGADRVLLGTKRIQSLAWSGRLAESVEQGRASLREVTDPELRQQLHRDIGRSLFLQGLTDDAAAESELALADEQDAVERQRLHGEAATYFLWAGQLDEALRHVAALDAEAEPVDQAAATMARCVASRVAALRGDLLLAAEAAEEAVRVAGDDPDSLRRVPHVYLGLAYSHADRPVDALRAAAEGERVCEALGAAGVLPLFDELSMIAAFFAGRWDDALAESEAANARGEEVGVGLVTVQNGSITGLIHHHRGEVSTATALAAAQWQRLEDGASNVGMLFLLWLEAGRAEAAGDPATAAFWLQQAVDRGHELGTLGLVPMVGPDLVRCLLLGGEVDRAAAALDRLAPLGELRTSMVQHSLLLRMRARIEAEPALALEALELLRSGVRPFDLVGAAADAGDLLLAQGHEAAAADRYEEALAAADDLGAALHVRRLSAQLRQLGRRVGVKGARVRPRTGWESLTATELTVARLVAEGRTNADLAAELYISRRTAETHVSHILGKLGLTGRVALAAEVARH